MDGGLKDLIQINNTVDGELFLTLVESLSNCALGVVRGGKIVDYARGLKVRFSAESEWFLPVSKCACTEFEGLMVLESE